MLDGLLFMRKSWFQWQRPLITNTRYQFIININIPLVYFAGISDRTDSNLSIGVYFINYNTEFMVFTQYESNRYSISTAECLILSC